MNRRTMAVVAAGALASHWGCSFLVDTSGIVGPEPVDAAPDVSVVESGATDGGVDVTDAVMNVDGMLAAWSFEAVEDGGIVPDITGNGHDGQLGSAAILMDGHSGRGLGSAMTVYDLGGTTFPPIGTLSFWLRADFAGTNGPGLDIFDGHDPSRSHIFVRVPNAQDHVELQLAIQHPAGSSAYAFLATIADPPSSWMHLTFVWNAARHDAAVYVGGKVFQEGELPDAWAPSEQQVVFAKTSYGKAVVDDVRLFPRALTADEVAALL